VRRSPGVWLIVMAACAAAAVLSMIMTVLFVIDNDTTGAVISGASFVLFTVCSILARRIWSRASDIGKTEEEISCLRLKRPGFEDTRDEEIVPKGKMPKG